jgi:O6-methylguanine-DNA--protein-cysteine methyltransferase
MLRALVAAMLTNSALLNADCYRVLRDFDLGGS